jgi:serine/threonine protein kinase
MVSIFLVMEYLDGETLANRLKKGPLPPEQLLQFSIQITDALNTAHKHGVIHRDLKPDNIMLTKSGAKLLDFGLAKVRAAEAVAGMAAMPTQTMPLTAKGRLFWEPCNTLRRSNWSAPKPTSAGRRRMMSCCS